MCVEDGNSCAGKILNIVDGIVSAAGEAVVGGLTGDVDVEGIADNAGSAAQELAQGKCHYAPTVQFESYNDSSLDYFSKDSSEFYDPYIENV